MTLAKRGKSMPRKNKDGTYMCREVVVKYGRRVRTKAPVSNSDLAAGMFREIIEDHSKESFIAIYLDAKNLPLGWRTIASGGTVTCVVDVIPLLQAAVLLGANSILIGHNHPTGDSTPSPQDVELTTRINDACRAAGFRLLDHVVVSHEGGHHSLRDDGLWPKEKRAGEG